MMISGLQKPPDAADQQGTPKMTSLSSFLTFPALLRRRDPPHAIDEAGAIKDCPAKLPRQIARSFV
jgi:hypothetical protein